MVLLYSRVEWLGQKVEKTGLDSGQEVVNQKVPTLSLFLTTIIRPPARSIFGIHDPTALSYLT